VRLRLPRLDPTRALQVAFLLCLTVCAGQVVYWIADEVQHTNLAGARLLAQYDDDVRAARALLDRGMDPRAIDAIFPNVIFTSGPERVIVNPAAVAKVRDERARRLNRYGWEGSFFLVVLVAGIAVIARALREEARLRRRQQNFLAAVTHEVKSPLASLRLSAETLALRDPEAERRGRLVARMLDDLARLDALVGNILDTARLEEGRLALQPERVSLAADARSVAEELAERARAAGARIELDLDDDAAVEADPVAARTIVRNLVDNALKAVSARPGGVVQIAVRREADEALLEVRDDGVGFDPREAERLFEKFYRPGDEMRRTSKGSGLGLYIVRRFAQLSRARVAASSEGPGRGASFTVRWPAAGPETSGS